MATGAVSTASPRLGSDTFPTNAGWKKEQVTESTVKELLVTKFKQIASSYEERKQARTLQDLNIGPWYGNDYAVVLDAKKHTTRHKFLIEKNAFLHGYPPQGFFQLDDPTTLTKKAIGCYQIAKDCLPIKALENIKNARFSFIDCGSAIQIAMYETLQVVLGDDRFNQKFAGSGDFPLQLKPHIIKTPLYSLGFVKEVQFDPQEIIPQMADGVYFSNVFLYTLKHLNGESRGFHALCISPDGQQDKEYITFGGSSVGKTESAMNDFLRQEFNAKPIPLHLALSPPQAVYLQAEAQQARADIEKVIGKPIEDFTITQEVFDQAILETQHWEVGLFPITTRLNIETIRDSL